MGVVSDRQIVSAASAAGFSGSDLAIAVAVALAESGGNSTVISRTGDYGLWQINERAHREKFKMGDWRQPSVNARMARTVWMERKSWRPWVTYNSGAYRLYLNRAKKAVIDAGKGGDKNLGNLVGRGAGEALDAIIPGGADAAANAVTTASALSGAVTWVTDPKKWLRLSLFVLGIALLLFGLFRVTGDNKPGGLTKTVASAVIKKKVG